MREPDLAAKIFELMINNKASDREGVKAICTALVISLIDAGVSKERAYEMIDVTWALVEPRLTAFNAAVRH